MAKERSPESSVRLINHRQTNCDTGAKNEQTQTHTQTHRKRKRKTFTSTHSHRELAPATITTAAAAACICTFLPVLTRDRISGFSLLAPCSLDR